MATRRSLVIASAVTTMAGLLGVGAVALRLGVVDGESDDHAATPDESGGDSGADASDADRDAGPDPNGAGVHIGHFALANFHSEPIAVGVTVERDGAVVYDDEVRLPAGQQSEGSASGTSVGLGSWDRVGHYVVTVSPPNGERRIDLADRGIERCAGVFAGVESASSVEVLVDECEA